MDDELNAKLIFDKLLPEYLVKDKAIAKKINAPMAIDLEGKEGGQWWADFSSDNPVVSRGFNKEAKCTICMNAKDFNYLISQQKIRPWLEAFKSKRITVKGHLPTALKLRAIVQAHEKQAQNPN